MRVFLFPRIVEVSVGSSAFERVADFDLAEFWRAWCADVEGNRPRYTVDVRVSQAYSPLLLHRPGAEAGFQLLTVGAADTDGWNCMILVFEGLEEARQYLLGMGGGVEVLAPEALRLSLADYARQILDVYSGAGDTL